MQEYCISDKGKRRRIEEMNKKRSRNRDRPKPHQAEQVKTPKAMNTVSGDEVRNSRPQNNRGGWSDRSNSSRGQRENSGRRQKVPYCCTHSSNDLCLCHECSSRVLSAFGQSFPSDPDWSCFGHSSLLCCSEAGSRGLCHRRPCSRPSGSTLVQPDVASVDRDCAILVIHLFDSSALSFV